MWLVRRLSVTTDGNHNAFIGNATDGLTDLGNLGNGGAYGMAINDNNEITGRAVTGSGKIHAIFGDAATGLTDLGTLGGDYSTGFGISEDGIIIGQSRATSSHLSYEAFLWEAGSGMLNLEDLVINFSDLDSNYSDFYAAYDISDNGQYITGRTSGGMFLLTRIDDVEPHLASAVPEPSTIVLMGLGVLGFRRKSLWAKRC